MRVLVPWQAILAQTLDNREIISVAAVVRTYLARTPTRSEITSARRAAVRYVAAGHAKAVHLPNSGANGDDRLLLAWPGTDVSDLDHLRRSSTQAHLPDGVGRTALGNTRAARALVVSLVQAASSVDEIDVERLGAIASRALADDLEEPLRQFSLLRARLRGRSR